MLTSLCALYGAVMLCAPAQDEIRKVIENLNPDPLIADTNSMASDFKRVKNLLGNITDDVLRELGGSSDQNIFDESASQFQKFNLDSTNGPLPTINKTSQMTKMNDYIITVETHRFWWSIGLFALFAVIAILSKFGVCFKSKV